MLPEEEAAGHDEDEDREKEILIERIQSIKEEKQVSLRPLPALACTIQPHPPVPPLHSGASGPGSVLLPGTHLMEERCAPKTAWSAV